MKKVVAVVVFLCCLLLFPISAFAVVTENKTFNDYTDDVFLLDSESIIDIASDKEYLDIKTLTYSREDLLCTITLEVNDEIKDSGIDINNLEDLDSLEDLDEPWVIYSIELLTSNDSSYFISYFNKYCIVNDQNASWEVINGGSTLKITFNLSDNLEEFSNISAYAEEMVFSLSEGDIDEGTAYRDVYPEAPLEIDADVPDEGETGEIIDFTSLVYSGLPPYVFEWDFGDGATASKRVSAHTYSEKGNYDVSLVVSDRLGATATFSGSITISQGSGGITNNNILFFVAIIAVIFIIGIIAVVYIIRR